MRGRPDRQPNLFVKINLEDLVPQEHPLRPIKRMADEALAAMSNWKRDTSRGEAGSADPPRKPETPTPRRFTVSDTTTEALAPTVASLNRYAVTMAASAPVNLCSNQECSGGLRMPRSHSRS
jgi:hypothetical protein